MNQGKVGAAFEHSYSYIHFQAIPFLRLDLRKIAYRTVQGITRGLSDYISRIEEMHFTYVGYWRKHVLQMTCVLCNFSAGKPISHANG
jgi:hypothetical protein